jgi:hypothetical protein
MPKLEFFRQDNPADQMVVVMQHIEGHAQNLRDGIVVNPQYTIQRILDGVEWLKALQPYLKNQQW